jgi:DNA-binding IclR family transcriptional regulator
MDKTLLKGLMVLEAVTDVDNPPRTIDALAARVGLTRSNTHRTLQTLIHAGYVIKDDDGGGYRGAVRLFELAARQLAQLDVRKLAAPFMRALADQTGETVHLSVLDGFDVVYIDKIDSPQPIRAYSMVGGRGPPQPGGDRQAQQGQHGRRDLGPYCDNRLGQTAARQVARKPRNNDQ